MGQVWLARHLELGVPVAIKTPLCSLTPTAAARFKTEARATAALQSQHIVRIYDYGLDEGVAYIAMELLEGETLRDKLSHGRRLSVEEASLVARHVARALSAAHERRIVHRDIKPSNLFFSVLDGERVVKVLDFGIAQMENDDGLQSTVRAKAVIGSPGYLSREQLLGEPVDVRSDLWSLGAVLFRALTGVEPFRAASMGEMMDKIRAARVPSASTLNPELGRDFDAFFARAMARDPHHRFDSAEALADAFEPIAARHIARTHEAVEGAPARVDHAPPSSGPSTREFTLPEGGAVDHAPVAVILRVGNVPSHPREFVLSAGVCRVGTRPGTDIVIEDDTVSRAHVEFGLTSEGVAVRDLGSRNGTFYLGQRIERAVLRPGCRIMVGRAEISIHADHPVVPAAPPEQTRYGRLHGVSLPMRRLFAVLARLEESLVNVLIEGESGTGKEVVARAIHEHSAVTRGPFVAVNCGALDRDLVRSELFGHRRGAFTTAVEGRVGAFELANGGTLFLDEIGELPLDVQPVLLRALESETVVRVGESAERPVKVRLVAATNRDLTVDVKERRFREDLYYRLVVVKLRIPPLRERIEDVVALAEHFATELRLGGLSPDQIGQLCAHPWPGNVRELKNTLKAYSAIGTMPNAAAVDAGALESALRAAIDVTQPYANRKQEVVDAFRKVYFQKLLEHTSGNQSEAARLSGLERSYLNKLVHIMGLRR